MRTNQRHRLRLKPLGHLPLVGLTDFVPLMHLALLFTTVALDTVSLGAGCGDAEAAGVDSGLGGASCESFTRIVGSE